MRKSKVCTKCKLSFPLTNEYFYVNKMHKSGFTSRCKKCTAEDNYYGKNKENISKVQRTRYENNREYTLGKVKEYREKNKDIVNRKKKLYRENNKELIREKARIYNISHPELGSVSKHKRIARKSSLPATLTKTQWEKTKLYFQNKCAYCERELPLAQDHFVALASGGEYTHDNIIPACKRCNSSKHARNFFEWYPNQEYYSKLREAKILKYLGYKHQSQQLSIF